MQDDTLFRTLRTLDAAPRRTPDEASRRRAEARLEQILAANPSGTPAAPPRVSPLRPTPKTRWLALSAVAVIAIGALVIVPTVTRPDPAYASWTPVPSTLTEAERTIAVTACLQSDGGLKSARPLLAERRGEWVGVVIDGEMNAEVPATTSCLMHLPTGSDHAESLTWGSSGGQGAVPIGGQFTDGSISQFGGGGLFGLWARPTVSFNVGDVGSDVAAVTIVDADGQTVQATVDDGRFVAWWPGRAFGDETEGNGGPAPSLTYSLTMRDGTVIDDAEPTLPR